MTRAGERVAVIGTGPGGLASARFLKGQGFAPTLFESHSGIGGQWNHQNRNSGIWPSMRTNTARFVTQFADLDYPAGTALFPRNTEVLAYLEAYAERFGLLDGLRLDSPVSMIARADAGGYDVTVEPPAGARTERFDKVVVATGRYNKPNSPPVQGLAGFAGGCGVVHAFHYKNPDRYRGKRVLVAGGSISALEIASDLATLGAERVHVAMRRQRYVVPKMIAGVPIEYFVFSRNGALALETSSKDDLQAASRAFLLQHAGDPTRYGAPAPHPDFAQAGVTGSQYYLNLVAEDRIDPRPWLDRVEGTTVVFTDGSSAEVDGIIIGTGFDLNLPFLSPDLSRILENDDKGLTLSDFTFHPDLEGLAFVGLWSQHGPYFVALEQQARYLAYSWSGAARAPDGTALRAGIEACRAENHHGDYRLQHEMSIRFARLAGVDPASVEDPTLRDILGKSAVMPPMFRIVGPDALPDAAAALQALYRRHAAPG